MSLHWKLGVEFELLAPAEASRRTLAERLAGSTGTIRRIFHPQSEPSKVPGTPIFENLTLGFTVEDSAGHPLAQCVDDLTLQQDLDRQAPPLEGWYRVLSDDRRLLRLVMQSCEAEEGLDRVLDPLAALFGTEVLEGEGGVRRVIDQSGASVAMGARLPGERHRPCELISPPLEHDHEARLEELLGPARELGFLLPREGAVHLHFDGRRLCSARAISNLVQLLTDQGDVLKREMGTNPACIRLGDWPPALLDMVCRMDFLELPWVLARKALSRIGLSKYCDFNLVNLVQGNKEKHTFEVRILPPSLEVQPVLAAAHRFQEILDRAVDPRPIG
jgi:hypothetical protein